MIKNKIIALAGRAAKKIKKSNTFQLTLLSILLGLLVGAVILLIAGYSPLQVYWVMLKGVFSRPKYISYTIIKAAPLILTGLSVAFAFRTGLFNIGVEGQFIVGSLAAVIAGVYFKLPVFLHIPVVLLTAIAAAGAWSGMAGYFKSRFGVHEVISTIMLNWIALYLNNFLVKQPILHRTGSEASFKILDSARIDLLGVWKISDAGFAFRKAYPVMGDILKSEVNFGIFIALIFAFVVWYIIHRTSLGYELRSVGFNRYAAEYGGINVNRSMVISMAISGGLAGAAGAIQVMGVTHDVSVLALMEGFGFEGIAVSLIGNNSAIGCVFAGLLFGAFKYGGTKIQGALGAPKEIVNIVIGMMVFFIAMPAAIKTLLAFFKRKKEGETDA